MPKTSTKTNMWNKTLSFAEKSEFGGELNRKKPSSKESTLLFLDHVTPMRDKGIIWKTQWRYTGITSSTSTKLTNLIKRNWGSPV